MSTEEKTALFPTVAVIGVGLIGSSLLRCQDVFGGLADYMIAIDASSEVRARVQELELASKVSGRSEEVAQADCVILCVPVGVMGEVARSIVSYMKKGAILIDTGSTKSSVINAIRPSLKGRRDIAYVPSHPMAGTEYSGPDAGLADLFENAWCLLTPIEESVGESVQKIRSFWRRCGAYVKEMSPQHHDVICAKVSHLPHFISFTICQMVAQCTAQSEQEIIDYSASGFRDFTRIAASDPTMWRDIFLNNRQALMRTLDEFLVSFRQLRHAIESGDAERIQAIIRKGNDIRSRLIAKEKKQ